MPIPRNFTFIEMQFGHIHQNFLYNGRLPPRPTFEPMGAKDTSQESNIVKLGLFDGLRPSKSQAGQLTAVIKNFDECANRFQ